MSDSPCTSCRSTRNGRLFFIYVNHYLSGDALEKRRLRLCRECVFELGGFLEGADMMEGGDWCSVESAKEAAIAGNTPIQIASLAVKRFSAAPSTPTCTGELGVGSQGDEATAKSAGDSSALRQTRSSRRSRSAV